MMRAVQEQETGPEAKQQERPAPPTEQESITEHTVQIGGRAVAYRAEARTTVLRDEAGGGKGATVTGAHTPADARARGERPLAVRLHRRARSPAGGARPHPARAPPAGC